jgi:hypothetical protein
VQKAQAGIGLVFGKTALGAAAEAADLRGEQELLNLRAALRVALVPLDYDALRLHMIGRVLGAVAA